MAQAIRNIFGPRGIGALLGPAGLNYAATIAPRSIQQSFVHTTTSQYSLMEFFDDPKNWGAKTVKCGRHWRIDELRLKSNSDLHKLWFVLYKERNMLLTMKEAAKEESDHMPSSERIDKVEQSMANLEDVVRERNKAYWQLEVSPCATGERPHVFRRDVFGRPRWHRCSQHLAPYRSRTKWGYHQAPGTPPDTMWFFRRYREMKRKNFNYERAKTARYLRDLFRRFPEADADYAAELHPEFPPGYVQHLKQNHYLYDDPPRRTTQFNVKDSVKNLVRRQEINLIDS